MKRISLFLFFIGCFLFSLSATNYFVATNGSDSNSGTIDKPFATLGKAQSKVMAGDTVYIRFRKMDMRYFVRMESGLNWIMNISC